MSESFMCPKNASGCGVYNTCPSCEAKLADQAKLRAFPVLVEALEHIMEVHDRQDAAGDLPWWLDSESWWDFDIPAAALKLAREASE